MSMQPSQYKAGVVAILLGGCFALMAPAQAMAQNEEVQQRVAALKQHLGQSQANLKKYEWIETTTITLKGEEKSQQQNRCYHGADGVLQKVPVTAPPEEKKKKGLRGKIVESKKEEMADYMKAAVALVRDYVPPDPGRIQACRDSGNVLIQPVEPNKRTRVTFTNYLKPGDSLGVEVDMTDNHLLGIRIATYLETPKEPVTLNVKYGALNDGTGYPVENVLDAPAKEMKVTIQNSGYRKSTP